MIGELVIYDMDEYFSMLDQQLWGFGYYKKHFLSNGQVCEIRFYKDENKNSYSVGFCVANKKKYLNAWFFEEKNNISYKCSGRCGLEALLWAKNQLALFERFVDKPCEILITGEDQKRFRVYKWALEKCGYKMTNIKYLGNGYSWAIRKIVRIKPSINNTENKELKI